MPRAKAPANPLFTGRPSQQLASNRPKNRVTWNVRPSFRVAAGITFQLPCGRDVGSLSGRARLCLLVAVARLAGRWYFWRLSFWRWCFSLACGFLFFFVSLFEGADPRTGARGRLASRKKCWLVSLRSCGPELFLRWSCHSMSSCDGVRPIFNRAGADLPEGVT